MLLSKFRETGPGVIILIFIITLALWISAFLNPQSLSSVHYNTNPMPLYGILQNALGSGPVFGILFSLSLVLLIAFLLVNFNTSDFFINERTFLPAVIYVLISGLFPQLQVLNPVLPAAVFLMLALRRIMDAYRIQGTAFNFFDVGILISIGSLFYANLIWFGLLAMVGIALLRTGNVREILISILGLVTPWILTFGVYYVLDKDLGLLLSAVGNNLFSKAPEFVFSRITIAILIILFIIIIVSLIYLLSRINTKKIKSRKTFYLLIWEFFISVTLYFLLPSISVEIIWLAAIAGSYFISHYFVFVKKRLVPEIFFTILFILIFLVQILYIF